MKLLRSFLIFLSLIGAALAAAGPAVAQSVPEAFWNELRRDNESAVQTWLLRGIDVNAMHPQHGPAIVYAARERSWRSVRMLAGLTGTRIDAPNPQGETALMLAALHGEPETMKLLIARGAEVNRPGWTPLHYAASGGHTEIVRYLLEQSAYIDAQSPNRTTPLMMAARQQHVSTVKLLIEAGADPTPRNDAGLDAASYMQRLGETELAAWLRERAADYERRYGTLERPRTVESIEAQKRPSPRPAQPQLPGVRN
ncbi:MAG: ankyrin repeat domain-containing protein [Burkholderiaceae bacterium]